MLDLLGFLLLTFVTMALSALGFLALTLWLAEAIDACVGLYFKMWGE